MIAPTFTRRECQDVLVVLSDWEHAAWHGEEEFLARFTAGGEDLLDIWWSSDVCRFTFLAPGGQTVSDSIPMSSWLSFYLARQ